MARVLKLRNRRKSQPDAYARDRIDTVNPSLAIRASDPKVNSPPTTVARERGAKKSGESSDKSEHSKCGALQIRSASDSNLELQSDCFSVPYDLTFHQIDHFFGDVEAIDEGKNHSTFFHNTFVLPNSLSISALNNKRKFIIVGRVVSQDVV